MFVSLEPNFMCQTSEQLQETEYVLRRLATYCKKLRQAIGLVELNNHDMTLAVLDNVEGIAAELRQYGLDLTILGSEGGRCGGDLHCDDCIYDYVCNENGGKAT